MTSDDTPMLKVERPGYDPDPFYFLQTYDNNGEPDSRVLAWTSSLVQLQALVTSVLETFSPVVDVLFKLIPHDLREGDDTRIRFLGAHELPFLLRTISTFEYTVFQDAATELCVRDQRTGEYLALDHYGIVFLYTHNDRYLQLLEALGYTHRENELVYEGGHWKYRPKGAEKLVEEFIRTLDLRPA